MSVAAGVGLGLATTLYGGIKDAQAAKAAKANLANRPAYTSFPEDDSELNLAQSMAGEGMGAAAKQALLNNNQSSESAALNAAMRSGGGANAIAGIVGKSQEGLNNAAIYDDQAQQAHLNQLLGTYRHYDAQRRSDNDKEFQVNKWAPWADKQQLFTQQQQAGQNMMLNGVNTLGKSLMSFGGGSEDPQIALSKGNTPQDYGYSGFSDFGGGRSGGQDMTTIPTYNGGMSNAAPVLGMAPYFAVP